MLCCREAARRMSTRHGGKGGAIVNVSSMAGTIGGRPGASHYAASKAAVDSFTMGFAKDVAAEGIRVNSLRPGMVLTEMTEDRLKDDAFRAGIESTIAMGRVGRAEEIADAILWLLSDEASFISGARVDASGGGFVFGKKLVLFFGLRASGSLMIMSEPEARGPEDKKRGAGFRRLVSFCTVRALAHMNALPPAGAKQARCAPSFAPCRPAPFP